MQPRLYMSQALDEHYRVFIAPLIEEARSKIKEPQFRETFCYFEDFITTLREFCHYFIKTSSATEEFLRATVKCVRHMEHWNGSPLDKTLIKPYSKHNHEMLLSEVIMRFQFALAEGKSAYDKNEMLVTAANNHDRLPALSPLGQVLDKHRLELVEQLKQQVTVLQDQQSEESHLLQVFDRVLALLAWRVQFIIQNLLEGSAEQVVKAKDELSQHLAQYKARPDANNHILKTDVNIRNQIAYRIEMLIICLDLAAAKKITEYDVQYQRALAKEPREQSEVRSQSPVAQPGTIFHRARRIEN